MEAGAAPPTAIAYPAIAGLPPEAGRHASIAPLARRHPDRRRDQPHRSFQTNAGEATP